MKNLWKQIKLSKWQLLCLPLFFLLSLLLGGGVKAVDTSVIDGWSFHNESWSSFYGNSFASTYNYFVSGKWGTDYDNAVVINNDSSSNGSFSVASSTAKTLDGGFSVCFWAKDYDGLSGRLRFNFFNSDSVSVGSYQMGYYNTSYSPPNGSYCSSQTGGVPAPDTNWNHFCLVSNNTTTEIYKNNVSVYSCTFGSSPNYSNINTLGLYRENGKTIVDDYVLFNRPLTVDEVDYMYNNELNSSLSFEKSGDYILYYGDQLAYFETNSFFDLPVVYDVCEQYGTSSDTIWLVPEFTESEEVLTPQAIPNCSGVARYTKPTFDEFTEPTKMIIYTDELGDLATSSEFQLTVYNPVITGSYIVQNLGNLILTDTTNASGTKALPFSYNVCNDPNYSTSTRIYLKNKDSNALTNYYTVLATCSGTSTISIPYFENMYHYFNGNLTYVDNNGNQPVYSENFIVGFSPLSKPTNATSSSALFDLSSHDLACSAEEWAEAGETGVFNFTKLKCRTFKSGLDIVFAIADIPKFVVSSFGWLFENLFPFNIPVKIKQAWDLSASQTLPSNIAWLDLTNENNDITLELPSAWSNGSSSEIVVFGDSIFKNTNSRLSLFFSNVRALTTYLYWGVFIFGIWRLGRRLYYELNEDNND